MFKAIIFIICFTGALIVAGCTFAFLHNLGAPRVVVILASLAGGFIGSIVTFIGITVGGGKSE